MLGFGVVPPTFDDLKVAYFSKYKILRFVHWSGVCSWTRECSLGYLVETRVAVLPALTGGAMRVLQEILLM